MKAPREVNYDDVDDVIGIAAELQQLDQANLSVEELEAVAKDLEIPSQYVGPAVAELRRRRRVTLEREAARMKRNRLVALAAAGVVLLLIVWAFIAQGSLASAASEVERTRARVRDAEQDRADKLLRGVTGPMLSGADNRVRTERMRYDRVVSEYNADVTSFPGSLWASIFGLPDPYPTSDQVAW